MVTIPDFVFQLYSSRLGLNCHCHNEPSAANKPEEKEEHFEARISRRGGLCYVKGTV